MLAAAEAEVMPQVEKTQCNTDMHAQTVYAQALDLAKSAEPVCAGQQAEDVFDVLALERYEAKRQEGLQAGLADGFEVLRVKLVGSFECEYPPVPEGKGCDCWSRNSGQGPVYCFPQDTFGTFGPSFGGDLEAKANAGMPQCRPESPDEAPVPIGSPLVVDLDGDGVRVSGAETVPFDLAATGEVARIGALEGGDALLAVDLDGDGDIDSGAELFGNATACGAFGRCLDGVHALGQHDQNGNGTIDAGDPIFARLVLWQDRDRDGHRGTGEARSLTEAGIVSIGLTARVDRGWTDARGNVATRSVDFVRADGGLGVVVDVWFALAFDTLPRDVRSAGIVTRWPAGAIGR